MTTETQSQFKKRLKSFLWRLGSVAVVAGLNFIVENVAGFGLPTWIIGIVGLACGEITKFINGKHQAKKVVEPAEPTD